ncbi:MAG: ABC transporter permease [Alkalibacterium gilvum]|uniref:ABC transporter permease n=1 Tax=Alkalibacterium gilvum TaxID=1130080 RepID=UPI000B864E69
MERSVQLLLTTKQSRLSALLIPILSVLLGFIFGALLMLLFGYNPIDAYQAMLMGVFNSPYFIGEAIRQATVLTFTGLGFAIAFKAGFFNIGIAGQLLVGWVAAIWVALSFPDLPRIILLTISIGAAIVAGAVWAGIAGTLRAYFGTSEVIVTIMLNYTALHLTNYIIRSVLTTGNTTDMVSENASLSVGWLTTLTQGSRINMGLFIAIIVVFLYWLFMTQTTAGFEVRAVGLNPDASTYAGMSAKRNIILSMLISGGLAGLGGAIHGLGTFGNLFTQSGLPSLGFNGIAVALLGLGNPVGIFFSSILFGVLDVGAGFMPNRAGVPDEMADIVIAAIIFFVGANYVIRLVLDKMKSNKTAEKGGE